MCRDVGARQFGMRRAHPLVTGIERAHIRTPWDRTRARRAPPERVQRIDRASRLKRMVRVDRDGDGRELRAQRFGEVNHNPRSSIVSAALYGPPAPLDFVRLEKRSFQRT